MTGFTTDPTDPRLGHGADETPTPQHDVYLVLSESERAKGFVRPYRDSYRHVARKQEMEGADGSHFFVDIPCGAVTRMGAALSETYARNPKFYGSTYCVACQMHRPVSEFVWEGTTEEVGS